MHESEFLRLLDVLKIIESKLTNCFELFAEKEDDPYQSLNLNEIAAALAKAKLNFQEIGVNRKNINGRYPDLPYILSKVEKVLAEQGITLYQYTKIDPSGSTLLFTVLMHISGQWISSRIKIILASTDFQNERTLSINARSQVMRILGIFPNEELLDDNGAEQLEQVELEQLTSAYEPPKNVRSKETITKEQYDELIYELTGYPKLAEDLKERFNISTLQDMPKENFTQNLARIRKIKNDLKMKAGI